MLVLVFLVSLLSRASAGLTKRNTWACSGWKDLPRDKLCDGVVDCRGEDESDETEGCQLFPDSNCTSWNGMEHFFCSKVQECFNSQWDAVMCQKGMDRGRKCQKNNFRCPTGRCIQNATVCDGTDDCGDGTDEDEGCEMFPDRALSLSLKRNKNSKIVVGVFLAGFCFFSLFGINYCMKVQEGETRREIVIVRETEEGYETAEEEGSEEGYETAEEDGGRSGGLRRRTAFAI